MIQDLALRQLAGDQHGLVAVEQAIELGYDEHARRRLVDERRWQRLDGRVYALVGAPRTTAQRVMHTVLGGGPGAAVDAESSLAWWGLPGMRLEPVEIVRPRGHSDRMAAGSPHVPVLLPPHHVVRLDHVPTVVPARALFDFAGSKRGGARIPWWIERVARAVDSAWSLRLVSGESLNAMLGELAQRGRPGISIMRGVLATRGVDYIPAASGLESRLVQLLERAGLPPMRRQVNVGNGARWIGRVDFADLELPFLIEVQSERFHTSQIDAQLDATRIADLGAAGYVVLELTDTDVWQRPQFVIEQVTAARRLAAQRARRAS